MTDLLSGADDLFLRRGALDIPHPGGTLLAHLRRVRSLLESWDASADLQAAGFCHAAYGTDGFAVALFTLDERPLLEQTIGEWPESLVYCYGSCRRKASYAQLSAPEPEFTDRFTDAAYRIDSQHLQGFLEITAANELDVMAHNSNLADRWRRPMRTMLAATGDRLSPGARAAWSLD